MSVKVSINGDGLSFEKEIEMFQATQIMGFIAKGELQTKDIQQEESLSSVPRQIQPALLADEEERKYESPKAAISALKAKTNPQKVVAISLYLGANSQNGRILNHSEILAEFSKAGEATPKNFPRDVSGAVADGYVYPESKTTFRLLSTTDNLAGEGFKKSKRSSSSKGNSGKREKLEVRPEVEGMSIESTLDRSKGFFDIKERSDKIMWILKYAETKGVKSLNRKEIFLISSKLGGDVDSKNFTSSHTPNIKNGYVSQQGTLISISVKGDAYVANGFESDVK